MSVSTSVRLISLRSSLRRAAFLSIGCRSKCGGMTGRWAKVHLPRLTSNCSGTHNSSRWPTADESTYWSLSKKSSCFLKPPSALAMSPATDGFSAMIKALPIQSVDSYTLPVFEANARKSRESGSKGPACQRLRSPGGPVGAPPQEVEIDLIWPVAVAGGPHRAAAIQPVLDQNDGGPWINRQVRSALATAWHASGAPLGRTSTTTQ